MDKSLHISGSSASEIMLGQAICAQNLSNVSTPGFKAAMLAEQSIPLYGDGMPSRVYVGAETVGYDFAPGSIKNTGNPLDLVVTKDGWLTVQGSNGQEGYTKRGDLRVENGMLVNGAGNMVIGDGGPISIPPAQSINIEENGTITITPLGNSSAKIMVDKIKLVKPEGRDLTKGEEGLFVNKNSAIAEADRSVRIKTGMVEASNVNAVSEMIELITLARQHELSLKMMSNAEENDQALAQLLRIG